MKGIGRLFCVVIILSSMFLVQSAGATYFSESLIYTGPPEFEEVHQYDSHPTYVNGNDFSKDIEVQAGWWNMGGRLHNAWDNTYQGWIYGFAYVDKDFKVTHAGEATISFSWDGSFQASGNSAYNGSFALWADAQASDGLSDPNEFYWYEELTTVGSLSPSEAVTFRYLFDEADIGDILTISFTMQIGIDHYGDDIAFNDTDSLDFDLDFMNGFKINETSGGITAVEGPPVPIPATMWLFGASLVGLVGIRKKTTI